MPAYLSASIGDLLALSDDEIVGRLESGYAHDGFAAKYTQQTRSWLQICPLLKCQLKLLLEERADAPDWGILLEFPVYRLRKRIDAVIVSDSTIFVIEVKSGAEHFLPQDERQAEEYALDLRDFNAGCLNQALVPILWATAAAAQPALQRVGTGVSPLHRIGRMGLAKVLAGSPQAPGPKGRLDWGAWELSPYRPVPNVIDAATVIFADHDVRAIARSDAENLAEAARRIVEIIRGARENKERALVMLTGVPGSGKTLAGLQVVHDAIATGADQEGDIVYLSGNTPLVLVLREALAQDRYVRAQDTGERVSLREVRRRVRGRIQHINDYLKEYVSAARVTRPHEHAIVFDEAQRAWDQNQGRKKFNREASEPKLLMDVMGQHEDWCACICLIGGGQEINSGEKGTAGWGAALREMPVSEARRWAVYGPPDVFRGGSSTAHLRVGQLPPGLQVHEELQLQLRVPLRSFRSPNLSEWVQLFLDGEASQAADLMRRLGPYPVKLTRSFDAARAWLREQTRGQRRCGLLASSGARRLRAEGLGVILNVTDRTDICHWYLRPWGDIRSSLALEVPANEYTCQGLELDFAGVCWGGDFLWLRGRWNSRRLSGTRWHNVASKERIRHITNSYRVLLTRAREGMVIWVPEGESTDPTRSPDALDATAEFLKAAGAVPISTHEIGASSGQIQ